MVIFTWVAGTTAQHISAFGSALDRMAAQVAELAVLSHGADLGFRDTNGDYALIGTFRDKASWDAYQLHPAHTAFVRDFVSPLQASRVAIQF